MTTEYSAVTLLNSVWCWITCFGVKGRCCCGWLWTFTFQQPTALKEERLNILLVTPWMPFNVNNIHLGLDKEEHWFLPVRRLTLSLLCLLLSQAGPLEYFFLCKLSIKIILFPCIYLVKKKKGDNLSGVGHLIWIKTDSKRSLLSPCSIHLFRIVFC